MLLVDDLVHYYEVVVRPVLEYVCPVWHYSLTKQQSRMVEDVQRSVVQIDGNIPYADACESMGISSLAGWLICVVNFLHVSLTMNSTLFIIYYLLSETLSYLTDCVQPLFFRICVFGHHFL